MLKILFLHIYIMQVMMLNERIQNISRLQSALARAEEYLSKLPPLAPYSDFEFEYKLYL